MSKRVRRLVYVVLIVAIAGSLSWFGLFTPTFLAEAPLAFLGGISEPATVWAQPQARPDGYVDIKTSQLVRMLREKDFLLIDVHFSFENELPKTDILIPFDQIEQNAWLLPADKDAKIAVYCVSPGMSDVAAKTLVKMGYTNVLNLTDGARDWQAAEF